MLWLFLQGCLEPQDDMKQNTICEDVSGVRFESFKTGEVTDLTDQGSNKALTGGLSVSETAEVLRTTFQGNSPNDAIAGEHNYTWDGEVSVTCDESGCL